MARISQKKNTSTPKDTTISRPDILSRIVLRPRITEKGTDLSHTSNAYAFDVARTATKASVRKAIKEIYKVDAVKVAIVPVRAKAVFVRGKKGSTSSGKKAYVYLKEGDKIEFV